jgi:hypothetical protein
MLTHRHSIYTHMPCHNTQLISSLALSPAGDIVVSDVGQNRVHLFSPQGAFAQVIGTPLGDALGSLDSPEVMSALHWLCL